MRPSLATVISPRAWEETLARAAMDTGLARLVARCFSPEDVPGVDVIVAGTETPWLSGRLIERWRTGGAAVIGMYPIGDRPAIDLLCRSRVDQLFVESTDPMVLLRAVRDLARLAIA